MSFERAVELASRGYAVFPIGAGKQPVLQGGHKRATYDIDSVIDMWAEAGDAAVGIGICPGACNPPLIALDVDVKTVDGLETLRSIDAGLAAAEPTQYTPSGGRHLLFRSDGEPHHNTAGALGKGLDTRGTHGYIKVYGDLPDPASLPPAPEWLLRVGKRRERTAQPAGRSATLAARAWIATSAPAAEEGRRNDTAFKVAARLRNLGLPQEAAVELMHTWSETKCQPPLDSDEIENVVGNAYRYSQEGPRADPIANVERLIERAKHTKWRVYYGDEFTDRPPPEWLIPGLIQADSLALITGAYRSYKTFVALDLALSLASGRPLLDNQAWMPARRCRVLYLCGEGAADASVRYRAFKIARGVGSVDQCGFIDDVPQIADIASPEFKSLADDHDVIVVDTLARVTVGVDENSNQEMGAVVATLDGLRKNRATPLTVIVVHHTGKHGSEPRGASALAAAADTILVTERIDRCTATLTIHKQKAAATPDDPFELRATVVEIEPGLSSLVFSVTGPHRPPPSPPSKAKFDKIEQAAADALRQACEEDPNDEPAHWEFRAAQLLTADIGLNEALAAEVVRRVAKKIRNASYGSLLTGSKSRLQVNCHVAVDREAAWSKEERPP